MKSYNKINNSFFSSLFREEDNFSDIEQEDNESDEEEEN